MVVLKAMNFLGISIAEAGPSKMIIVEFSEGLFSAAEIDTLQASIGRFIEDLELEHRIHLAVIAKVYFGDGWRI